MSPIEEIKKAAIDVLLYNLNGPFYGLPRTAGWGYPEPYTRDWMIASLGILTTGKEELVQGLRRLLEVLAANQTHHGHISSLAHDPTDTGASDTTPLFLIALALYRLVAQEPGFLEDEAQKALVWLKYQSPDDSVLVAQQPTSDWRDEQWVWGYGLYVNTLVYACLKLYGEDTRAEALSLLINHRGVRLARGENHVHEGLGLAGKPYYAFWVYKQHISDRFDLLGNSLAILFGVANPGRAQEIIAWVETSCRDLQNSGDLACDLPPCFFPYIHPGEADWLPRYAQFNQPGEYHNGGIWPFVSGLYIAALVAVGEYGLAEQKLASLSSLVKRSRDVRLSLGFNEWHKAQDCTPRGQDWQSWTAAIYLYAAACVENRSTLFFGW